MESAQNTRKKEPPNGGYGWVIVLCSAISIGFVSSVIKSAGLIYVTVLNKYPDASKELVATMTTIVRGIMFLIGVISVNIAECYSYKLTVFVGGIIAALGLILCSLVDDIALLILTFGGITGIGTGLIHAPCVVIIGSYFTTKRSTAMGLMLCLSGTIIAFMPVILQYFMDVYGLQGALLLWGGLMLEVCVVALLIRQPTWTEEDSEPCKLLNTEITKEKPNFFTKLKNDFPLLKENVFLLLLGNRIAFFINNVAVLVIIPDFIEEEATEPISQDQSALLLSVLIFGDVISRGLSGFLLDWFPSSKTTFYLVSLIVTAWITVFFQWTTTLFSLILSSVMYGIVTGTGLVLTYLLVYDYYPSKGHSANAIQQSITGLSLFLEGPIIGGLWSVTGNYNLCWDFLGIIVLLSVILWMFKR